MDDAQLGRAVRALRHRRGWRQADLAREALIGRGDVSDLENGRAELLRVKTVRRAIEALGGRRVRWDAGFRSPEVARLLDAGHAALQNLTKLRLEGLGWQVIAEASFNHFGERGRIDLLAYHPATRTLMVIEIKTIIFDIQELLGALDVKVRIARHVAVEHGWQASAVVPCLVVTDSATSRRRVGAHAALFSRFTLRGRAASAWLRRPEARASGLLIFRFQSPAPSGSANGGNRARVRTSRAQAPSNRASRTAVSSVMPDQSGR